MHADKGESSILTLLDLTAAFDIFNYAILLDRLQNWVGISGTSLNWFDSYLSLMSALIIMFPLPLPCCEVSRRGRFLVQFFSPCTCFLWMICSAASMTLSYHCYADDAQIYFSAKPNNLNQLLSLHERLAAIKDWMSLNFLHLNPDKTEIILFGHDKFVTAVDQFIAPLCTNIKPTATNLGIIFDQHMTFDKTCPVLFPAATKCSKNLKN